MKLLQIDIRKYLEERNWDKLRPSDISKSICIEASELLEVFQWENLPLDEIKVNKNKIERVRSELADVLIFCLEMATLLEIDSEEIIREKLRKATEKYPPEKVRETNGKEPGTDEAYLAIKKTYRSQK